MNRREFFGGGLAAIPVAMTAIRPPQAAEVANDAVLDHMMRELADVYHRVVEGKPLAEQFRRISSNLRLFASHSEAKGINRQLEADLESAVDAMPDVGAIEQTLNEYGVFIGRRQLEEAFSKTKGRNRAAGLEAIRRSGGIDKWLRKAADRLELEGELMDRLPRKSAFQPASWQEDDSDCSSCTYLCNAIIMLAAIYWAACLYIFPFCVAAATFTLMEAVLQFVQFC
jgi:hypothetical protein